MGDGPAPVVLASEEAFLDWLRIVTGDAALTAATPWADVAALDQCVVVAELENLIGGTFAVDLLEVVDRVGDLYDWTCVRFEHRAPGAITPAPRARG